MDLLAIDTYSNTCSVAFFDLNHEKSTLVRTTDDARSHASMLAVYVSELIEEAGKRPNGIVVVSGPGSYTGLRIGASTAKGLAWSMELPLYAVSTLLYLASMAPLVAAGTEVVSLIKAREGEVFLAQFRQLETGLVRETPDRAMNVIEATSLLSESRGAMMVVSDHIDTLKPLQDIGLTTALIAPSIKKLFPLLLNQLSDFNVQDQNSFEPTYLKEFVARKASKSIFDRLPF